MTTWKCTKGVSQWRWMILEASPDAGLSTGCSKLDPWDSKCYLPRTGCTSFKQFRHQSLVGNSCTSHKCLSFGLRAPCLPGLGTCCLCHEATQLQKPGARGLHQAGKACGRGTAFSAEALSGHCWVLPKLEHRDSRENHDGLPGSPSTSFLPKNQCGLPHSPS